jgi:hypothetical protein
MGESNLLRAIWDRHASRAALWRALCLGSWALTALALVLCLRLLNRPREVIRIGCDGIPQLVRLDTEQYTEPNEREMQAFVRGARSEFGRRYQAGGLPPPGPLDPTL